ncbi:MAG TPA: hypothetical protein VE974_26985 [Thermoanaerobaculia bacterium]|nr:hypothetical protein [Thermoanaerobaculia bacterium]
MTTLDPETMVVPAEPAQPEPEMLVQALRYLQRRVPGFVQLSLEEEQSMTRAAYLDPELIDRGIYAAGAWPEAEILVGRNAEELRQEADDIRRWDELERELHVFLKGIASANLKRKHRLGKAILLIYKNLGIWMSFDSRLRPYYEEMKRAYMKRRKKTKKAEPKKATE